VCAWCKVGVWPSVPSRVTMDAPLRHTNPNSRRMNVALTRAKRSLWLVCHAATLRNSVTGPWAALLRHAASKGVLKTAQVVQTGESPRDSAFLGGGDGLGSLCVSYALPSHPC
jgi:hypothetical protein